MKIPKARVSVLVGVLAVLAVSAFAAEQKPVVEQLLEIMKENGQITEDQHDALLDQARREQEEAAEALVAAREAAEESGSSGVKVTTNYKGLQVKTADGRFEFGVGGRIQADFATLIDAPDVALRAGGTFPSSAIVCGACHQDQLRQCVGRSLGEASRVGRCSAAVMVGDVPVFEGNAAGQQLE